MSFEYGSPSWARPEGVECISTASSGYFTVQCPEQGIGPETMLLVVLHGWGQNCRSFLRKFAAYKKSDVLVVAPQAPHQFYLDMATRKVGFGWMTGYDRHTAVPELAIFIDTVLDAIERDHGARLRPIVLGFSQGVSVAYRYAMLGSRPTLGIIACGGDLPPDVAERLSAKTPFPVLLVHGKRDTIVPIEHSESAAKDLSAAGYPLNTLYFEGEHDIPGEAMERILDWMSGVAARRAEG